MRLFVYDKLVNVNVIYYVHVCEQARWARSAGNSAIENLCIIIICYAFEGKNTSKLTQKKEQSEKNLARTKASILTEVDKLGGALTAVTDAERLLTRCRLQRKKERNPFPWFLKASHLHAADTLLDKDACDSRIWGGDRSWRGTGLCWFSFQPTLRGWTWNSHFPCLI